MGLDLQASVGITLGDIQAESDRIIEGLRPHADPRPFYLSRTATAYQLDTTGVAPVTLDLGAPPTGSIWQLRAIITFGSDAFTGVNNSATTPVPLLCALFTGDSLNLSLATLKIPSLPFPFIKYVPDTCLWCHPNENLVIQTMGLAPGTTAGTVGAGPVLGQQIGCNVVVEEWKERDVSRDSGR
jgi:hypothetical protein